MKLTNLPLYILSTVAMPELSNISVTWLENGDVEVGDNASEEQIELLREAIYLAAGVPYQPLPTTEAQGGARQWFMDNPATALIFTLSVTELETEINTLVDALFPTASAGNRTKVKKLWMVWCLHVRIYARERGWV